jgi:uncharacterized protein (DUF2336 family)
VHSAGLFHIGTHDTASKPERLLLAAVTAFCALPRPTRREITQLDDLAQPLIPSASDASLRFVAAALSETRYAPPSLVRRICDAPVEICAPLLARSPVLSDVDLITIIGRHGLSHARAISRRAVLDERIVRLITALGVDRSAEPPSAASVRLAPAVPPLVDQVEETRQHLRGMMRPAVGTLSPVHPAAPPRLRWNGDPDAYSKLRSTALTGVPALFQTALADALELDFRRARAICVSADISELIVCLRALGLGDEHAFFIASCIRPSRFPHARAVAAFLDAYSAVSLEDAQALARCWKSDAIGTVAAAPAEPAYVTLKAANQAAPVPALKAS